MRENNILVDFALKNYAVNLESSTKPETKKKWLHENHSSDLAASETGFASWLFHR